VATGFAENMRQQLQCGINESPVYLNALLAVKNVRLHLQELHLGLHKDKILAILDDRQLFVTLHDGSLSWADAVRVFRTIIYAMRFCVGTDAARAILYDERTRLCHNGCGIQVPSAFEGSCSNADRFFSMRPMAYNRLLEHVGEASRGGNSFNLRELMSSTTCGNKTEPPAGKPFAKTKDIEVIPIHENVKCALDEKTYKKLMGLVQRIEHADSTKATSDLGVVFCDTLLTIIEALNKLDVCLTNANISSIRVSTFDANVNQTQLLAAPWFQQGLGLRTTLRWLRFQVQTAEQAVSMTTLRQTGNVSIVQLVYSGYVSLLMHPKAQQLDEVNYPELLILDIEYIQNARGFFYGFVAQATVFVIIGQRLTE